MPAGSEPTGEPARRLLGRALSATIIGAAIVAAVYVTRQYYVYPRTDDAYVRANLVGMAPHVSGPIINLPVVDDRVWYVVANFRENFLPHIKPGMSADVFLLSYPGRRFRGRVQGVGCGLYQQNGATALSLDVSPRW